MIPLHWTEPAMIPGLDRLVENQRQHGGALVEYQRVWSLVMLSTMTPKVVWVSPGTSRIVAGLPHTLFCLALGWWSLAGFFWTISALITNLSGGIDVTAVFTTPPGQPIDEGALREMQRQAKVAQYAFVAVLFLILGVLGYFLVWPALRR